MTETASPKPVHRSIFARILEVLLQPQRTFALIAEETRTYWQIPMLALSISTFLSVMVSGYLKSRAALMGEAPLLRDWQWWTPEMQENYMRAQQAMQGPVFAYIIPLASALIGLWLGWLILSGLLHLGSTLFGGRGSMRGALNITGWASLPFLMRDILRIVYMLLSSRAIASPGFSGFTESSVFLAQIFARVDIFFLWSCILLVIGFGLADALPRAKATANIVLVSILLLLVQAGVGTVLANLSGLAVQRPFF